MENTTKKEFVPNPVILQSQELNEVLSTTFFRFSFTI